MGEPDALKMVMEGIDGQIQPPEWIQDMLMWPDIPRAGHPSPTLLPICVTGKTTVWGGGVPGVLTDQ